jgi:nardilysin
MRVKLGHPKKNSTSGLKKSAAGLCVGMGSFSDPEELPGLAHFLEHMVCFMTSN